MADVRDMTYVMSEKRKRLSMCLSHCMQSEADPVKAKCPNILLSNGELRVKSVFGHCERG